MNSSQLYVNVPAEQAYKTPASNSTLLPLLLLSLATQKNAPKATTCVKDEYDFIVVGGGSAGSVVASRLSEDANTTVLLLEAGGIPPLLTDVPGFTGYFKGTDIEWNLKTVFQRQSAFGKKDNRVSYSLAKVLGGGSSLNNMLVVRGNRKNYDDWEAQGADGWSYKKVLPYFKKMEDFQVPLYSNSYYHGTAGNITMTKPNYSRDLRTTMKGAVIFLGAKEVDINAERQTGFWDVYSTIRHGQRCSTAKAYLVPAEDRPNLDIFINAQVTKVLIKDKQATGVEYYYGGGFHTVKAKKEVIVSAGVINTPKLLMLSGLGPEALLAQYLIPKNAILPVGENLQDHPGVDYFFTIKSPVGSLPDRMKNPLAIQEYARRKAGPLASSGGVSYGVFLTDSTVNSTKDFPTVSLIIRENTVKFSKDGNYRPDVYKQFIEPYRDDNVCSCHVTSLQPKSRGRMMISSANPFDPPLVDPFYLTKPEDLEDLLQGMKFCKRIFQTLPFKLVDGKPFETKVPGCEQFSAIEDEYLKCYARTLVSSSFHDGVGTSKMGDPSDLTTVVDPQLNVKGVQGLRVVDASVMPTITSGSTNIPTIMIAEKASDMIKKKYSSKKKDDQ